MILKHLTGEIQTLKKIKMNMHGITCVMNTYATQKSRWLLWRVSLRKQLYSVTSLSRHSTNAIWRMLNDHRYKISKGTTTPLISLKTNNQCVSLQGKHATTVPSELIWVSRPVLYTLQSGKLLIETKITPVSHLFMFSNLHLYKINPAQEWMCCHFCKAFKVNQPFTTKSILY